tara:strand:+ start:3109 stop:3507 length:399 start_codon:yes stop_codon:yes gene_type:complete
MSMTVTNVDLHGATIDCINAETETLSVSTAETLAEGLILARNTTNGNLNFYTRGGSEGLDVPRYVLLSDTEVTAEDVTATTKNVRVMQVGSVRQDKISIKAGGTIDYREIDGLKDNSISVVNTEDFSILDNQ